MNDKVLGKAIGPLSHLRLVVLDITETASERSCEKWAFLLGSSRKLLKT